MFSCETRVVKAWSRAIARWREPQARTAYNRKVDADIDAEIMFSCRAPIDGKTSHINFTETGHLAWEATPCTQLHATECKEWDRAKKRNYRSQDYLQPPYVENDAEIAIVFSCWSPTNSKLSQSHKFQTGKLRYYRYASRILSTPDSVYSNRLSLWLGGDYSNIITRLSIY